MAYERIDWENEPSVNTPINEDNLNHMEDGIVANEEAIGDLSTEVEGKQDALTFDNTPTTNSSNPVTSGGIKTALDTKLNKNNPSATGAIQLGTGAQASSQYGMDSIAIGTDAYAIDMNSTAVGHGAKASVPEQAVLGDYNVLDATSKVIIGGGSDDNDRRTLLKFADSTGDATFCAEVTDGTGNTLSDKADTTDVLAILPTDSASGNPCVITDAFNTDAKSVKLTLNPIQSGSGTPSPQNVRPISGRTQSVVTRCGVNLVPYVEGGTINQATGADDATSTTVSRTGFIPIGESTTFTISGYIGSSVNCRIFKYKKDKTYITNTIVTLSSGSTSISTDSDTAYIRMQANVEIFPYTSSQLMVNIGNNSKSYEPYNGESITRTYGTTIYGGTDDVTGEGLASDWYRKSSLTRGSLDSSGKLYQIVYTGRTIKPLYSTSVKSPYVLCSHLETLSLENARALNAKCICQYANAIYIGGYVGDENTLDALLASNDFQVFLKIGEPVDFPLTAQNLPLLKGDNVITTDADSIDVEYAADIALYIAKKIAEGVNSTRSLSKGGSSEPEEEIKEEVKEEETPKKSEEIKEETKEEPTQEK